jgi:hypothetical protein
MDKNTNVGGAFWPDQATLTAAIKALRKNRPENRRYKEAAAARRVIDLMGRECAGTYGNYPLGPELDAKLEKLLC